MFTLPFSSLPLPSLLPFLPSFFNFLKKARDLEE
jgi:hypothetical protein